MDDAPPRPPTLGERLAATAGWLRDRHVPEYPWAAGLAPVLRRADALSHSWARRFERDESGGQLPELGGRPPAPPDPAPGRPQGAAAAPAPGTGQPLPADVRARLREVAGPGAETMRVRVDASADVLARAHRADAVTVGTEVHVRSGRYRPDTAEGFALLAHEASHVTALLGRAARRATPGGPAAEEAEAARVEAVARHTHTSSLIHSRPTSRMPSPAAAAGPSPVPPLAAPGVTTPAAAVATPPRGTAPAPAAAAAGLPMRADTDRADVAAQAPFLDLEALRQSIVDDLMRRVRTDFERGG